MDRFSIGSCSTSCCRIEFESTDCVASTSGDWPVTVMVSVTLANYTETEATVRFRDVGEKTLLLAWAPLQKL